MRLKSHVASRWDSLLRTGARRSLPPSLCALSMNSCTTSLSLRTATHSVARTDSHKRLDPLHPPVLWCALSTHQGTAHSAAVSRVEVPLANWAWHSMHSLHPRSAHPTECASGGSPSISEQPLMHRPKKPPIKQTRCKLKLFTLSQNGNP